MPVSKPIRPRSSPSRKPGWANLAVARQARDDSFKHQVAVEVQVRLVDELRSLPALVGQGLAADPCSTSTVMGSFLCRRDVGGVRFREETEGP